LLTRIYSLENLEGQQVTDRVCADPFAALVAVEEVEEEAVVAMGVAVLVEEAVVVGVEVPPKGHPTDQPMGQGLGTHIATLTSCTL
jgi:hypothetical protein